MNSVKCVCAATVLKKFATFLGPFREVPLPGDAMNLIVSVEPELSCCKPNLPLSDLVGCFVILVYEHPSCYSEPERSGISREYSVPQAVQVY